MSLSDAVVYGFLCPRRHYRVELKIPQSSPYCTRDQKQHRESSTTPTRPLPLLNCSVQVLFSPYNVEVAFKLDAIQCTSRLRTADANFGAGMDLSTMHNAALAPPPAGPTGLQSSQNCQSEDRQTDARPEGNQPHLPWSCYFVRRGYCILDAR